MRAVRFGLLLAPCCLFAQWRLFIVEGANERPATEAVSLGRTDASDTLEAVFRLRNLGPGAATLHSLSVSGAGFTLASAPPLPAEAPPSGALPFTVRFRPAGAGRYPAVLTYNLSTILLWVEAVAGPVLRLVSEGSPGPALASDDTIDFGAVPVDAYIERSFVLENPASAPVTVALAVTGVHFVLVAETPVTLGPGESTRFVVYFSPVAAGEARGRLHLDGRGIGLFGTGLDPPLPPPRIVLVPEDLRSGRQAKLTVRLASASRVTGAGRLRIEFAGAADDPAVQFLSPAGRVIPFSVEEGSDTARFGERTEVDFQTGTTAGTIVFTAELRDHRAQAIVAIEPEPVTIDSMGAARVAGGVEVRLTGFDNTRSASALVFTFFDAAGVPVEPGPIRVDAAADFRRYFETSEVGGLFALRAVFPVTGDVSAIRSVAVEAVNAIGTARVERKPF